MRITAVLLAAGLSIRMGQNKFLIKIDYKPMLSHVLELIESMGFYQFVVVTNSQTASHFAFPSSAEVVLNHDPQKGQGSSVRLGTHAAKGDGYLFFTGDQPFLDVAGVEKIVQAASENRIVVPTFQGVPGSPVLFGSHFRQPLLQLEGDSGGKQVRDMFPQLCTFVEINNKNFFVDLDDPEQYRQITGNQLK